MSKLDIYDSLRHFADSWGLVFMMLSFLVLTGWTLRPSARSVHQKAANSIFEEDIGEENTLEDDNLKKDNLKKDSFKDKSFKDEHG